MAWIIFNGNKILKSGKFKLKRDEKIIGQDIILERSKIPKIFKNHLKYYALPFQTPSVAVDILIKGKDNSFIMIKRKNPPYKNYWALPGGFVDVFETVEEAAVREAKEETCLDVKLEKIIGVYSGPKRDPRRHVVAILFLAKAVGGILKGADDASEAIAFTKPPKRIAFDHRKMLKDAGIF
ncbi:MAG: NUDIX hydrolase [bacterium]|nr:NUDIX hydrolase [bacterium]